MTITFHHPPVPNSTNPLVDFQPADISHYPGNKEKGIYIYGIRAKVDGGLKFIPIVVGEGGDLRKRLYNDHYLGKFATPLARLFGDLSGVSGDAKEIWDFSKYEFTLSEIIAIYADALIYDTNPLKISPKVAYAAKLNNLIFFQDETFFYLKHGMAQPAAKRDIKVEESIKQLFALVPRTSYIPLIQLNSINQHITRILSTLINLKSNFYYLYASNKDENNSEGLNNILTNVPTRKDVEFIIKDKLSLIHIYTTADAKNSGALTKVNINLSKIQNELVNVGSHRYIDTSTGEYKKPLIY